MKRVSPTLAAVFVAFVFAGGAIASTIKVWSNGQTLTAADLNANFSHIHSTMVGGHGARLVDADVNASAAIQSSKLAGGGGIADAWGTTNGICSSSPCATLSLYGATNVTRSATGVYSVNGTGYNTNGACVATTLFGDTTRACICFVASTTSISVTCRTTGTTANDDAFAFVMFSN